MYREKSFEDIRMLLDRLEGSELPGSEAQYEMAPLGRHQTRIEDLDLRSVRKAAVLLPIVNNDGIPEIILTQRTEYQGVHSGQISLPGGKEEESDRDFRETALRETHEEIGVAPIHISVVGPLSKLYIPPSNFLVQPFVGILKEKVPLEREESEVQRIIHVDLNVLFHPKTSGEYYVSTHGHRIKVPGFKVDQHIIWGATAMMLSEFRALLK